MFALNTKNVITLNEKVNEDVALMCSKLTLQQFKNLFDLSSTKRHDNYELMPEYKKVINYCNEIIKSKNNHCINYGYTEGKDIGRLQSKNPSLQRIYNGFRGILCNGKMIDFDMCNCHPKILLKLCMDNNINCDKLFYYIQNRDKCLSELMSEYDICRGEAKSSFLKCINKIDYTFKIGKKKIKKDSFFQEFDLELTNIVKSLYKIYKKDEKYKKYITNEWNKEGKLINLVLQNLENNYLQYAINELVYNKKLLKKEDIGVLMFDGFMAYDDPTNLNKKDEIIIELNNSFKKFDIKWDYKEHNIELLEHIEDLEQRGELIQNDKFEGQNIIEIIDYMLDNILKNKLYKDDNNYYYITNERILIKEKLIKSELFDLVSKQSYILYDDYKSGNDKMVNASKIPKHIKDIVEGLIDKCQKNLNFIDDIWNFTQHKLFFLNGYFDFKENKFIKNRDNENSNKTFIKINRKFEKSNKPELRKLINDKIFYPIFTYKDDHERKQLLDYFMYSTAHYLSGNISLKRWSLFQGLRNSGKGIIGDLLKNCFEKYVMTTNSGNFNFKKNVTDSQKSLSWLIDYQFVRIALTSEISIYDDIKLDGNMIKKFTSGGDYIMARKNFQDEMEFKIQAGLIVCCNDCPPIEPNDALEFCDEYNMKSKFIEDDFDEEDKIKGFTYYKKDNTLKDVFLKRDDIINEIINMFIESYYIECEFPDRLKKENKIDNIDDDQYKKLSELFIFTNDSNDIIKNEDLKLIIKHNNITFTSKKVKRLLKDMGAKDFRNTKYRGLCNIKLNSEDDSEDEE
jgi:hypothetical protein